MSFTRPKITRIKIFNTTLPYEANETAAANPLEVAMNEWIQENYDTEIVAVKLSTALKDAGVVVTCLILYKEYE
jgi:hypothetical protein